MDCPFFVRNGGHFVATLVAPWFLNKTYKLDPLWIRFFVLYKIDDWAQIDSSTPSASKMAFIGPRLKVKNKNGPKIATVKFPKKGKGNFDFGGMESPQTWFLWLHNGLAHSQGSAQGDIGPLSPLAGLRSSLNGQKMLLFKGQKIT